MHRWTNLVTASLLCVACGAETLALDVPPSAEEGAVRATAEPAFCVDHPCADLYPANIGRCPLITGPVRLRVFIVNQGTVNSLASVTRVSFPDFPSYNRDYSTPGLAASGGFYAFYATAPSSCVSPGCAWRVVADATNLVSETNGSNNTRTDACIR